MGNVNMDSSQIHYKKSAEYNNVESALTQALQNGSEVSIAQTVTSGTELATITIDGDGTKIYAPESVENVSVTQTVTSGTKLATVTVDDTDTDIYAPTIIEGQGAGYHNNVYRGKSLGTSLTDAQSTAIQNGTFDDLFIGDYWTIGGVNYRIAAFDYYFNTGDTDCTTHHVTIVPDTILASAQMNSSNTTEGAYVGSEMYTTNMATAKNTIESAFGSAHILSHRQYLKNAVTNGYESNGAWYDSTIELMTEQNIYGGKIFANCIQGTNFATQYTVDKSQYPLFAFDPTKINIRVAYWLRDVANASAFCFVHYGGYAGSYNASNSLGVRPAFSIY